MNGQFLLPSANLVIQFLRKGEILPCYVIANLAITDNVRK